MSDIDPTTARRRRRRPPPTSGAIEPIEIQEEMERSFLDYSMSVIVSRALPDARDGLKPVHRRILWGMYDMRRPARPAHHEVRPRHRRRDGQVPPPRRRRDLRRAGAHGPALLPAPPAGRTPTATSARSTIRPAAARYTECRLAPIAMHMLDGHRRGHRRLHRQLLGRVRGARRCCRPGSRTCWSTAARASRSAWPPTSRPTTWARSSTPRIHLHRQPRGHPRRPDAVRQGPRLPDRRPDHGPRRASSTPTAPAGARSACAAVAEIEEGPRSDHIVVTELPVPGRARTSSSPRSRSWSTTASSRASPTLNDESARARPASSSSSSATRRRCVILNNLYKHTPLQTNFAVNTVALVDGVPRTLNLRDALVAYIDHQVEVITRRSSSASTRPQDRAHIVEGLLKALDMIDAIIAAIRASADKAAARDALMAEPFEFTEVQAEHILDMPLSPPDPPRPDQPRGGDGPAARDHRRARGDPRRRRQAPRRHQGRAGRDPRRVRHSPASRRSPSTSATSTSRTSSTTRTSSSR